MTRSSRKEKRRRNESRSLFNSLGMPQRRGSLFTLESIPSKRTLQTPASSPILVSQSAPAPLMKRNPNIEVRLSHQRNEWMSMERPRPRVRQDTGMEFSGHCGTLGKILRDQNAARASLTKYPETTVENMVSESLRMNRNGTKVEWLKVVQVIEGVPDKLQKTLGCIAEKGADVPLISSVSGWGSSATYDGKILDSASWTKAVREFCELVGHELPSFFRDREYDGQYQCCHVEKRLILFFVCHFLSDEITGRLDARKLQKITKRPTPLEAIVTLNKAPCPECEQFRNLLQKLTGIIFRIEISPEVAQTKTYIERGKPVRRFCRANSVIPTIKTGRYGRKRSMALVAEETGSAARGVQRRRQARAEKVVAEQVFTRNPRIMVLIPRDPASIARPQDSRADIPAPSLPVTPVRPTRSNRLYTPPKSPFSFETLDKLRRRSYLGKQGSSRNPFLLY